MPREYRFARGEFLSLVLAMSVEGWRCEEIAAALRVDRSQVARALRALGVAQAGRHGCAPHGVVKCGGCARERREVWYARKMLAVELRDLALVDPERFESVRREVADELPAMAGLCERLADDPVRSLSPQRRRPGRGCQGLGEPWSLYACLSGGVLHMGLVNGESIEVGLMVDTAALPPLCGRGQGRFWGEVRRMMPAYGQKLLTEDLIAGAREVCRECVRAAAWGAYRVIEGSQGLVEESVVAAP